jgi:hypothetical protein
MLPVISAPAAPLRWAAVVAILALSPVPMAFPSWIGLAVVALAGSALVLCDRAVRRSMSNRARPTRDDAEDPGPMRAPTPPYVFDVSRPAQPWRWTSAVLAPLELLALVWTLPLVILLIMVPVGLAVTSALWLGRLILGRF